VRLAFTLAEARRLFLIVRGPAPSCDVAGVIPVRGHRGANTVDFSGRAEGRNLPAGNYSLSLSNVRHASPGATATLVRVVSKRRSVPARPGALRPDCTAAAQALAAGALLPLLRGEDAAPGDTSSPSGRRDSLTSVPPATSDQQHDVLGVALPGPGLDSGTSSEGLASLISIAILALIGAILLTTAALVTRFLRGSWNP